MTSERGYGPPIVRIVLVGFMGSGKTTAGRRLADRLGWEFIDFDEEIERRTGRSVPEIFRLDGEPAFRELEARLTDELAEIEGVVLAPGGGWITQPELLDRFGPETFVVWLRVSPEEAVRRAERDPTRRPLLAGPDPLATARGLIAEREPLYRLADAFVDVDDLDPAAVASVITEMIDEDLGA